jgi:hypothetical protein
MAAAIDIITEVNAEFIFGNEPTIDKQIVDEPVFTYTCSNCGVQEQKSKIFDNLDYICVKCDINEVEKIYKEPHDNFTDRLCLQALFLSKRIRCNNKDCLTKNVARYTLKGLKMNSKICKYYSIKKEFPNALDSQGKQLGFCTSEKCKFLHQDIEGLYMIAILPDDCKFGDFDDDQREPVKINLYKQSCYKPLAYRSGCNSDKCYREHEIIKLLDNIKKPNEKIAFQKFLEKGNRTMLNFDVEGNFISDPNTNTGGYNKYLKTVIVKA